MIEAVADTVMVTAYASVRSMRTEQRELATALERHLIEGAEFYLGPDLPHLQSVDSIERALADGHHGTVLAVLKLADPNAAIPLLRSIVASSPPKPTMVEISAATILALLGDHAGVTILRDIDTRTSSAIEFFYAKAGLLLLGEPLPERLRRRRSVFRDLEDVVDRYLKLVD